MFSDDGLGISFVRRYRFRRLLNETNWLSGWSAFNITFDT